MNEVKKIFSVIPKIMDEVGAIEKTRRNTQGNGYDFRGIDDVYAAFQPLFAKHGVFFTTEVLEQIREERASKSGGNLLYTILKMKFTFFADDGSSVPVITIGEAMDSGDKSANKAQSAGLKVACLQLFCVPTQEPKDTENETHAVLPKKKPTITGAIKANGGEVLTPGACSHCNSLNTMIDRYNNNELYCRDCKKKTEIDVP